MSSADVLVGLIRSLTGSLLEIYVLEADRSTWGRALRVVAGHASSVEYFADGEAIVDGFEGLRFEDGTSRTMRALVAGCEWTSTLYREDQVDLQVAPEDFLVPASIHGLLHALQEIADATGRAASLVAQTVRPEEATPLALASPKRRHPRGPSCESVS